MAVLSGLGGLILPDVSTAGGTAKDAKRRHEVIPLGQRLAKYVGASPLGGLSYGSLFLQIIDYAPNSIFDPGNIEIYQEPKAVVSQF